MMGFGMTPYNSNQPGTGPYPSSNLFSRGGIGSLPGAPTGQPQQGFAVGGPVHWTPTVTPDSGGISTLPAVTAVNPAVVTPPVVVDRAPPTKNTGQINATIPAKMTMPGGGITDRMGPLYAGQAQLAVDQWNRLDPSKKTLDAYLQMKDQMNAALHRGIMQRYSNGSSFGGGGLGGNYGSSGASSGGGRLA